MDQQQAHNINQASEELTESAMQAFQMLADRTVSLQESNLRITQDFFQNWIQQIQSQTEVNLQAAQSVQEQSARQQQALLALTQESPNAYSEFLNAALSFYQETLRSATQATPKGMQGASQAIQQAAEVAEGATQTVWQGALAQGGPAAGGLVASSIGQADDQAAQQVRGEPTVLEYSGMNRTAAIRLIDELLAEDPGYDEETWPEIAEALDRDRLADRKLFVD